MVPSVEVEQAKRRTGFPGEGRMGHSILGPLIFKYLLKIQVGMATREAWVKDAQLRSGCLDMEICPVGGV